MTALDRLNQIGKSEKRNDQGVLDGKPENYELYWKTIQEHDIKMNIQEKQTTCM